MIFDELPDDIINNIYSKIIYSQKSELLDEIKKYGLIKEWLYYLYSCDKYILEELYTDLLVIDLCIKENKIPISVNIEQLSENSLDILNDYHNSIELINIMDDYDEENIIYIYISNIKNLIMKIDYYYIKKIIEPIIAYAKYNELTDIGYLTYEGVLIEE